MCRPIKLTTGSNTLASRVTIDSACRIAYMHFMSQTRHQHCDMWQADGTAWMAFFSRCMLQIALELALVDPSYEDMAVKFLDHFTLIASALNGDALHQGTICD
jgi:hypothetical protein